jgi:hypothetical protein
VSSSWENVSALVSPLTFALCGTRRFINVFTINRHCFLSWANWIQSKLSQPITLRSLLILSSYLCPILSRGFFTNDLLAISLHACVISLVCATCPVHLIFLPLITLIMIVKSRSTTNEVPGYGNFSILLVLTFSWGQTFCSAASNTLLLDGETTFCTHVMQRIQLQFSTFWYSGFCESDEKKGLWEFQQVFHEFNFVLGSM